MLLLLLLLLLSFVPSVVKIPKAKSKRNAGTVRSRPRGCVDEIALNGNRVDALYRWITTDRRWSN